MNAHISEAMSLSGNSEQGPDCNGLRCLLGMCIPWKQVCDGITDCPDGADERPEHCHNIKQRCDEDIVGCSKFFCICIIRNNDSVDINLKTS